MVSTLTFSLVLALIFVARPLAARWGVLDRPGGHKAHQQPTPVIGGILIFVAMTLGVLVVSGWRGDLLVMLGGLCALTLVGAVDDIWHLKPWVRLSTQTAVVSVFMMSIGLSFGNLGSIMGEPPLLLGSFAAPFTIFAAVGLINAINLVDGMDGLAAGLSTVALALLLLLALGLGLGNGSLLLGGSLLGGLIAFLLFNMRHPFNPRASIFLGDAGSLLIGGVLVLVLFKLTQSPAVAGAPRVAPVLALWVLAIPLLDTCSVMLRRMLCGKNPMAPDRQHLHHLLSDAGLPDGQAVAVLLLASITLGGGAIALWILGAPESMLFIGFLMLAALFFLLVRHPEVAVRRFSRWLKAAKSTEPAKEV